MAFRRESTTITYVVTDEEKLWNGRFWFIPEWAQVDIRPGETTNVTVRGLVIRQEDGRLSGRRQTMVVYGSDPATPIEEAPKWVQNLAKQAEES